MDKFLESYFSSLDNLKTEKLPGDGGHRDYTRLRKDHQTFILMSCGKQDPSLKKFVEVQKRLAPWVCVPKLFHKDYTEGLLILEDLGDQSLEDFFLSQKETASLPFYYQALTHLIAFQSQIEIQETDLCFDIPFFKEENEMAIYNLQTYINKLKPDSLNEKSAMDFKKDMEKLLTQFKKEDYVYCHRDYHSRNLMLKDDRLFIIDFQDAGGGPWYYDLASLLYDCYVPLSPSCKQKLSAFYFENLPQALKKRAGSPSHTEFMVKLQFLQRGFKACGRFAAFQNENQKSTHLKYIRPTLELLKSTALELSYKGIHKYLQQMTEALGP